MFIIIFYNDQILLWRYFNTANFMPNFQFKFCLFSSKPSVVYLNKLQFFFEIRIQRVMKKKRKCLKHVFIIKFRNSSYKSIQRQIDFNYFSFFNSVRRPFYYRRFYYYKLKHRKPSCF